MTTQFHRAPLAIRPAVHRTVLVVDIEGFGRRTNPHQVIMRDAMYRALERAFRQTHIRWTRCYREDRGDGIFVLVPAEIPKGTFIESLPEALAEALHEHNRTHRPPDRIRLRMALHAGEINYDNHGVTAAAITLAFRLVNADRLKAALAESSEGLALIVSSWFFHEVVRNSTISDPATYSPIEVAVKETKTIGWIRVPQWVSSTV